MEKTEKLTQEELEILVDRLDIIIHRFWKLVGYTTVILCIPLFVPISILRFFSRKARNMTFDSEFLLIELGPLNVVYFLVIPLLIILVVCCQNK